MHNSFNRNRKDQVFAAKTALSSNIRNQIADADVQCFRDFDQRTQGNLHVSTFNLANKVVVEVCLLGQLLLRQARLFAAITDLFAHNAAVIWPDRHDFQQKQEGNRTST